MNPLTTDNLIALLAYAAKQEHDARERSKHAEMEIEGWRTSLTRANGDITHWYGLMLWASQEMKRSGMTDKQIQAIKHESRGCEGVCCGPN